MKQVFVFLKKTCRIICTGTPENGCMAGDSPICLSKRGAEVPFHQRCRSRHILGVGFLPAYSQTCPKSYLCNFTCNFSPTKIVKTFFWCDLQKRSSCVFLQTSGAIFWSQATFGAIFTRIFRDFAQIFSKSKRLGLRLHPHLQHHCFSLQYHR